MTKKINISIKLRKKLANLPFKKASPSLQINKKMYPFYTGWSIVCENYSLMHLKTYTLLKDEYT